MRRLTGFLLLGFLIAVSSDALSFRWNKETWGQDNNVQLVPILTQLTPIPKISAKAVIIADPELKTIIYASAASTPLPMASTTKIMTALVALDLYQTEKVVTVATSAQAIGSRADLYEGEHLTVTDLLYALLLSSGNDAAVALGQLHPQGYAGFVAAMNQNAKEMGLKNTHFMNVSGIDQLNHFTTAEDLVIMGAALMKKPVLAEIVGTKQVTITNVEKTVQHTFTNLNTLLTTTEGVKGIKTGKTELAGECLVTYIDRQGKQIMIVLLGSQDRFEETKKLIDWIYEAYEWKITVELRTRY